jgi:hypothetical protein
VHRHTPPASHHSAPAVVAGAVLVLAALVLGLLTGCGADESARDPGYTAERRAEFLAACEESASLPVCACAWDRITDEVPAERFVAVSEGIARGEPLPADLAEVAERCATDAVLDRG